MFRSCDRFYPTSRLDLVRIIVKSKSFQSLNICEVPYHLDVYVVYCLDHSDWFVVGSVCLDHSD